MDDKKLDQLLDDAARSYRVPPPAPLDDIWARVEAEAFATPRPAPRSAPGWKVVAFAAAASLVLGVAVGRVSRPSDTPTPLVLAASEAAPQIQVSHAADQRATEEFLGRTALLLAALPRDSSGTPLANLPEQAGQLLTSARLLLDSPMGGDPRMRDLLQDLELVLAQVARLQPRRENIELSMITQTIEAREVVTRMRSAVTDLGSSDF